MGITREEKLLNSIANGVYSGVQPVTREEQYLSYIAGESYAKPEKPITRKELYLDKIPQGGSGGGGVTIRNQNKTITANGTYTADSGYTGLGIVEVNVQASGVVSKLPQVVDKTVTEITAEDLKGASSIKGYAFRECLSLQSITIPASVTSIGSNAFENCKLLTSLSFEKDSQLESIADYVFKSCSSLTDITIPRSVTSIGAYVAQTSSSLDSIVMESETPPTIQSKTFSSATGLNFIFLPPDAIEAYKSATNWSSSTLTKKFVENFGSGALKWLFKKEGISANIRTDLPAPTDGISYTMLNTTFTRRVTSVCENGVLEFRYYDEETGELLSSLKYDASVGGWYHDVYDKEATLSSTIYIKINV
jgi:hypothetical protein